MDNDKPAFLTPAQVVERWGNAVTTGTLANWRCRSIGPAFQKFGSRVRYTLAAVEKYERDHVVGANDNKPGANDNKPEKADAA
jgi:hypothetical protein